MSVNIRHAVESRKRGLQAPSGVEVAQRIYYDPERAQFPDPNEYHPVVGWSALTAAVGETKVLGFKVGNGWLSDPMSDATFGDHFRGAQDYGLIPMGYWFGAQKVDRFLQAFPPAEGRIACLDFEFLKGHVITRKDADDAGAFVTKLRSEWGRWPLFYGGYTWRAAGQPTGTPIENCAYWGPAYQSYLEVPTGVGTPFFHQFTGSSKGPLPHRFAGVSPTGRIGFGPDINSLLVPFAAVRKLAGLDLEGGDFVLKDEDAQQLGYGHVSDWRVQEMRAKAVADVLAGRVKRMDQDAAYLDQYDQTAAKIAQGGGGELPDHKHALDGFPPGTGSVAP